jgi:hypothetical protein
MKREYFSQLLAMLAIPMAAAVNAADYRFDSTISKQVLENYLERSISYTELLHDDLKQAKNSRGVDPRDNIRFLTGAGVKLVGRSLMMWGGENRLPTCSRTPSLSSIPCIGSTRI